MLSSTTEPTPLNPGGRAVPRFLYDERSKQTFLDESHYRAYTPCRCASTDCRKRMRNTIFLDYLRIHTRCLPKIKGFMDPVSKNIHNDIVSRIKERQTKLKEVDKISWRLSP